MLDTRTARRVVVERARDEVADRLALAREVREGLLARPRRLPSKLFYDDAGSALFDEITRLPEYYPTRTEARILEERADDIVAAVSPRELVELGSGSGRKIRLLLDAMARGGLCESCVLLDVHEPSIVESGTSLAASYPGLQVRGIVGDFSEDLDRLGPGGGRLALFLAGTIGNLERSEAPRLLARMSCQLEPGDAFLVGFDLVKDEARLHAAYNDAAGVTGRFNRNILEALNHEMDADFDPEAFEHLAFYDRAQARIEMWLRASRAMHVRVPGAALELDVAQGEAIRTEISCKYTRASVEALLPGTRFGIGRWLTDPAGDFALALLLRT
jgi:L-histidine N-alpha-methyltransferase